jgi:serine phosphatase RsbU (regulator of sigma subunit)
MTVKAKRRGTTGDAKLDVTSLRANANEQPRVFAETYHQTGEEQPEKQIMAGAPTAVGIIVDSPATPADESRHTAHVVDASDQTSDAIHVLVQNLFAGTQQQIPRLRYAIAYKVAGGNAGGDIADVFHYNNDHISFVIADVAGKGNSAALQAAMIKYGLRTLASSGLMPETVMGTLNHLYLENNAFENNANSFATVFFGVTDATRRFLYYSNAGHEPVFVIYPDGESIVLSPTAPIIGVFGDQHNLFKQSTIHVPNESLLVATTDGVTEARNSEDEQYGMARLIKSALTHRTESESDIAQLLLADVDAFSNGSHRDDVAIIVTRFLS